MSKVETNDFGSSQTMDRLREFFRGQAELLVSVQPLIRERQDPIWRAVSPLLYSINDTNKSLLWLTHEGKLRDVYILSRTVFETIVNGCFILARGNEAAERAYQHAMQKAYRDLDRRLEFNEAAIHISYGSKPDLSRHPELEESVAEFTTKRGRELTSWTPETVKERIEVIGETYGNKAVTALQFGLLAIYRHASDIAHGTLFGALFAIGMTQPSRPPQSPEALALHQRSNLCMLLTMLGGAIDSLLHVLGRELGETGFVEESARAVAKLREEPWVEPERASRIFP